MRRGPVSAAAMQARAVPEPQAFLSEHCSAEEYDAFLAGCDVAKHFVQQRRSHRKLFVQAWPDLEAWLHAPLADRIGRIDGQTRSTLRNQPSYWARAYLYYLALTGRLRLDYTWLLAVGDLCVHDVVRHLRIDLGVETLAREGAQLGLIHDGADRTMRWTLGRIALHSGPRPIKELGDDDIDRFLVAVRTFGERPDLDSYWTSAERYRDVAKAWITMIGQLRLVLYHGGQVREAPRRIMPSADVRSAQPAMGALVDKWVERRAASLRPSTVYHLALAAHRFLGHLAATAPEIDPDVRGGEARTRYRLDERDGDYAVDQNRASARYAFAAGAGRPSGAVLQGRRGLGVAGGAPMAPGGEARSASPA